MGLFSGNPEFIIVGQTPTGYQPLGSVMGVSNPHGMGKRDVSLAVEQAQKEMWDKANKLGATAISNLRISRSPSSQSSISSHSIILYGDAIKKI